MLGKIIKTALWMCIVFIYVSMIFQMEGIANENAPVQKEWRGER